MKNRKIEKGAPRPFRWRGDLRFPSEHHKARNNTGTDPLSTVKLPIALANGFRDRVEQLGETQREVMDRLIDDGIAGID